MTREDIERELQSLSWNKLKTYCKDNNLDIKGLKKEEVINLAVRKRLADVETLNSDKATDIDDDNLTPLQNMTLMKTATIQNLNPSDAKLPSKVVTVGNMEYGFPLPSYVVQFGMKQRLPNGIIKYLQKQEYRSSKSVRNKQGVPVTVNVMNPYYQVIIHPE